MDVPSTDQRMEIQCNNESPPAYDMPGQAPATRYQTGYRDKPSMTTKVNAVIPGQAPAVPYEQECTFRVNWKS